jgi:uncharacterized protein (TIGR04141 family)
LARKPRREKLTVSLLKEELGRDEAMRDGDALTGYRVPRIDKRRHSLFAASKPPHPPPWAKYLSPHVSGDLAGLNTSSAAAVLILEAAGRIFAITFGGGRHLIEPDSYVQDFGLKVVLNTVAPDQLKSVDAKTIDDTTVHSRLDLSHESSFGAFGLDVSRDLLRAVTGKPKDETLAHRLTGADSLGIHTRDQVPDLPTLCERLLGAYEDDAYKENFDFIDHLRPVKSKARKEELNELLVQALEDREIDDVHLAAPETLDWQDIDGFRFNRSDPEAELDADPRISAYLDACEDEEIDLQLLKDDRLIAIRASDGAPANYWPIRSCLVYQVELEDGLYVLSTGDWFRVENDYRKRVEAEVEKLPRFKGLPDADAGTDEDDYNLKAAKAIGGLCLDKKFVFERGYDKMEVCDVLTADGGLIHVKQRGSSSTLSHLFTQGVNSAERLLLDDEFRDKARKVVKKVDTSWVGKLPATGADARDHEITFAVITRSDRKTPLTLPFFSVVGLRAAAERLRAFGFAVSVAEVHES